MGLKMSKEEMNERRQNQGPRLYYVSVDEVIDAQDVSGTKPYDEAERVDVIAIELTFKGRSSYDPQQRFAGDLVFTKGIVTDWGKRGWLVRQVLEEAGIFLGNDGFSEMRDKPPYFGDDVLAALVGKKFARLRYASKLNKDKVKVYYSNFNIVLGIPGPNGDVEAKDAMKNIEARFLRQVDKGYPKNYDPTLLEALEELKTRKEGVPGGSKKSAAANTKKAAASAPAENEDDGLFDDDNPPF